MAEQKSGEITKDLLDISDSYDDSYCMSPASFAVNSSSPALSTSSFGHFGTDDHRLHYFRTSPCGVLYDDHRLHYFPTSPFDVLYDDHDYHTNINVARGSSTNNDSGGGGGGHAHGTRGDGGKATTTDQSLLNPDPCVINRTRSNKKRDDLGLTRETSWNLDDEDYDEGDYHDLPRPPWWSKPGKSQQTTMSSGATTMENTSSSSFYENINDQLEEYWNTKITKFLPQNMEYSRLEKKRVQRAKQRNLDMEFLRLDVSEYPEEAHESIQQQKARIMNKLATGYYDA